VASLSPKAASRRSRETLSQGLNEVGGAWLVGLVGERTVCQSNEPACWVMAYALGAVYKIMWTNHTRNRSGLLTMDIHPVSPVAAACCGVRDREKKKRRLGDELANPDTGKTDGIPLFSHAPPVPFSIFAVILSRRP
jgi:hypothetical protein